ncbi:hypothetical protein ASPACDRAFT_1883270 [Aspergillus aculeatus ATCC 16872]|uniref:FAD-dependent oxidoreductase 2 FAD-binding domain-containing protein n=1 Tax=Aspergillus aculeatus (strain ATCC 16872 / CBS 172.66 / WB 5094) TaxID=690307 RepID=A0A1L9WHD0_ASPA1|nr:uncharacterized protein ASPACDRAFT_1883270 [Aspergillus aculeatus ATCC 16872]OJJ95591.1 hypothetical protein ASPACDRAFT_1883270 [Aspergillus aculeatus ATCC 16872]
MRRAVCEISSARARLDLASFRRWARSLVRNLKYPRYVRRSSLASILRHDRTQPPNRYDVLVIGGSNAALVAALSAHQAGARVAIFEAALQAARGGNSRFSKGQCDRAQLAVMLSGAFETVTWMSQTLGVKWQLPLGKFFDREKIIRAQATVDMPPWDTIMAIGEGMGLMADLWAAVEQRPEITVFHSAPVADLIAEGDTIRGLRVRHRETTAEYFGQVILGCGGFEASARLRRQYLGEGWDPVSLRGGRFNTGRMMEKAVAAGMLDPSDRDKMSRYSFPYSVLVNTEGRRFLDEGEDHFSLTYAKTGAAIVRQPQATAFQVFDQKTLHLLEPRYATSKPIHADTLPELAQKMGVDATNFAETIRQYNAATPPDAVKKFNAFTLDHVSTGTALAIPKSDWALPINQGPFVAYGVTCGITFTYGGLRTDDAAHVLNEEGLVMPGLWAVGEISGGFFAFNYPGGSG